MGPQNWGKMKTDAFPLVFGIQITTWFQKKRRIYPDLGNKLPFPRYKFGSSLFNPAPELPKQDESTCGHNNQPFGWWQFHMYVTYLLSRGGDKVFVLVVRFLIFAAERSARAQISIIWHYRACISDVDTGWPKVTHGKSSLSFAPFTLNWTESFTSSNTMVFQS